MTWKVFVGLLLVGLTPVAAEYPYVATHPDAGASGEYFHVQVNDAENPVLAQRVPGSDNIVWMTSEPVKNWKLVGAADTGEEKVRCRESEDALELLLGDKTILRYHKSDQTGAQGDGSRLHPKRLYSSGLQPGGAGDYGRFRGGSSASARTVFRLDQIDV